jgi:integrase
MANKDGHRRFGSIRTLGSGRYQARYPGPDGRLHNAPETFARKSDAEQCLTLIEAQLLKGEWTDPERAKVKLGDYAEKWIVQRPGLRPRTVELYTGLLKNHIRPYLGGVPLGKLDTAMIREWRAELLGKGASISVAAKAYRLLRAVLMTASQEDRIIPRNPCRIKGAADENTEERPVLTVAQVFELADSVGRRPVGNVRKLASGKYRLRYRTSAGEMRTFPETFTNCARAKNALVTMANDGQADVEIDRRFRALVLLATFASLRWGEVAALRRKDIDLVAGVVHVRAALIQRESGKLEIGPPKSRASKRTIAIPAAIIPALREHLDTFVGSEADAFVFLGARGKQMRRSNFRQASGWMQAVTDIGAPGLHFHDLRHTGNMWVAPGTSLADLKARMGHDSVRAAMIYQHATSEADQLIAAMLNTKAAAHLAKTGDDPDDDGAAGVLAETG